MPQMDGQLRQPVLVGSQHYSGQRAAGKYAAPFKTWIPRVGKVRRVFNDVIRRLYKHIKLFCRSCRAKYRAGL